MATHAVAEAFNFSRAGLVSQEQLRSLRGLDEQFARNLTHTLGAWLRTTVTVTPQAASQAVFLQFMEKTASGHHQTPLRLEPMHARCVMALGLDLAPLIIDMLLGGSGRVNSMTRELTEIETAILSSVLDIVLREWNTAWSAFDVEFATETQERETHGKRWMPLQEKIFLSSFTVTLGDQSGEMFFCLPSSAVISAMRAYAQRRDRQRRRPHVEQARMLTRLRDAGMQASLQFPAMRLRAADLCSLKPGSLLPLPLPRGTAAEVRIGGTPVFYAQPVRAGEHRGASLTGHAQGNSTGEQEL